MPFFKVDSSFLDSTRWQDPDQARIVIAAGALCRPHSFEEPVTVLQLDATDPDPEMEPLPAGIYGFVEVSGPGLLRRCMLDLDRGYIALRALAAPEPRSRSGEWDGRTLVRVNGGFILLNYMKYRAKSTQPDRQMIYRQRQKLAGEVLDLTAETDAVATPPRRRRRAGIGEERAPRLQPFKAAWEEHVGTAPAWSRMNQVLTPLITRVGEERVLLAIAQLGKTREQQLRAKGETFGDPLGVFARDFVAYDVGAPADFDPAHPLR